MRTKKCKNCGVEYAKPYRWSLKQWEVSKYCSRNCSPCSKKGGENPNFGKHFSEERKKKHSDIMRKVIHTSEWNNKVSIAKKGKKMSEDFCKKVSERMKGKPSWNKGLVGTRKGKKNSTEHRRKISEGIKLAYDKKG